MKYYIGIDMGTSSVKITCIDETGEILSEKSSEYEIKEPKSGWKEIEPETWIHGMDQAFLELLKEIDSKKIEAIGVTGQMHTLVTLDKKGQSIRPALMWNDTRTADMIPDLKKRVQNLKEDSHISNIISTGSPAANLLWIKDNEPENFEKIYKFIIGPDYIVFRLTGQIQTDYCEASTSSLCSLKTGKWSDEMRRMLGFSERIYPSICGSLKTAGYVTDEWRRRYGLGNHVRVLAGTGDNPAAAISTGCFVEGYPVLSLGTSGVLMYPRKRFDLSAKGKNILFSMNGKDVFILVQGVVQSTGSSLSWWIKNILGTSNFAGEAGEIDTAHLGENALIFYPHLVGDKTIYQDPKLQGAFLGIGTDTTRKDMTVAVMEGIAFAVRQLADVMCISKKDLAKLKVTGGGAKNEVWMQILSDVLNTEIGQLDSTAGAVYGIALAAGCKDMVSMKEMIHHTVSVKKIFVPREYNARLYEKKYQRYLKVYQALQSVYREEKK